MAGDKLGAETVSVQSMNVRQIENSQGRTGRTSLATISMQILPIAISSMPMLSAVNSGRTGRTSLVTISIQILPIAISITGSAPFRLTYKAVTIMQYIFIVALEFVIAFTPPSMVGMA